MALSSRSPDLPTERSAFKLEQDIQDFESASTGEAAQFDTGSFRDRTSRVFYREGEVCRALNEDALREWSAISQKPAFQRAMSAGSIVGTEQLPIASLPSSVQNGEFAGVLRHERIPFISYPYEWPFSMLREGALLHLDLLADLIADDVTIKDGTAYNVQFRGSRPVFIDVASFEQLDPKIPWAGYRQFCQTFLYPLLLQGYKNVSFHPWLRGALDGIDPENCWNLMSFRELFRRGVLTHVYLHAQLQKRYALHHGPKKKEMAGMGFNKSMLEANISGLRKLVAGLQWKAAQSTWSDYATHNTYTDVDREKKESFVRSVVASRTWPLVWDLGCNTGTFSRIAAQNANAVVAMDADHLAVERLYQSLKAEGNTKILPLVNNLADSSPGLGWRGKERVPLPARGKPQLTLCLALIHHLVLGANIPLAELIEWLAGLGTNLIIEFVDRGDPMVQALLRNKPDIFTDYQPEKFEQLLGNSFRIERREALVSGTRTLFYATQRT